MLNVVTLEKGDRKSMAIPYFANVYAGPTGMQRF